MIRLNNVTFSYNGKASVLSGVNLTINKGETLILTGENGSGKTTVSKLLNGLLIPDSGDVLVDELNTRDSGSLLEIRRKTAVLFENPDNQILSSTVREDIAFGLENLCVESGEIKNRISFILDLMDMENIVDVPMHYLSSGDKMKVVLAGMLVMEPDYIILDNTKLVSDDNDINRIEELIIEAGGRKRPAVIYIMQFTGNISRDIRIVELSSSEVRNSCKLAGV